MKKKAGLESYSTADLYSEIGRRRAALVQHRNGGKAASCDCGTCPKCRKREQMRKYRSKAK